MPRCCDHPDDSDRSLRTAPHEGQVVNRCCGGKDLGPISDAEDPSDEDLERFSGVTRTCPECRTEVYDEAELCYNCGHAFGAAEIGGKTGVGVWVMLGTILAAVGVTIWFAIR